MAEVHSTFGLGVIGATAAFTLFAGGLALSDGANVWLEWGRIGLLVLIGAEIVLGAVTYATGARPDESLHLLYGVLLVGALPLANRFAEEAPPKPRATVLAVTGIVMLLLLWRLVGTG